MDFSPTGSADAVAKRYRPWPKGLRADSLPWFDSPLVQGASRLRYTDKAQMQRPGHTGRKALATKKDFSPTGSKTSPAAAKPVPQAVSGPTVPVQQAMPHSVTPQAAVRTQHDDIRQRLFGDSVQRQLFARYVPQRPQRAPLQGTPSGLNPVPKNAPPGDT